MEKRLNESVKLIEISGIRKFNNVIFDEKNVVSLAIGEPDFPTPENTKKRQLEQLKTIV